MDQPIILDKVLIVDDSQAFFVGPENLGEQAFNQAFQPPAKTDFELQEQWINAIAHCPFLMPEHFWKLGNLQVCISFIPAEPYIADDDIII